MKSPCLPLLNIWAWGKEEASWQGGGGEDEPDGLRAMHTARVAGRADSSSQAPLTLASISTSKFNVTSKFKSVVSCRYTMIIVFKGLFFALVKESYCWNSRKNENAPGCKGHQAIRPSGQLLAPDGTAFKHQLYSILGNVSLPSCFNIILLHEDHTS